ncbi:MAG: hypothetical protein KJ042_11200, partial [Deltaproteobacteria bacterium]|nr:hypothetical protein [Deltaproteobacteria bacterium]
YDVTGFRNDAQTGYVEGSFPRPEEIPDGICADDTIANHMDFVVTDGAMTGTVTFYCGTIDELNELFTYDATGDVTCGDFAM